MKPDRCTQCGRAFKDDAIDMHYDNQFWCPHCYILFYLSVAWKQHGVELDKEDVEAVLEGRKGIHQTLARYGVKI